MGELIARLQRITILWKWNIAGDVATRALHFATIGVVALGLFLRARGVFFPGNGNSMWLDEARWALLLIEEPLSDLLIRPIGFMAITKALVSVVGAHTFVFRLLSWLGGIATTLMAVPVARRLFRAEAARLLFVAVLVLHPAAIDLSKEFKPYAIGLALHTAMLLWALRYKESGSTRDLVTACSLAAPAVLFSQDVIFAYPGVFIVLGLSALRSRRTRHLVAIGGTALFTLALIGGLYFFIWSRLEDGESKFWGKKYGVFYVQKNNPEGKADWFLRTYAELTASLGERRDLWTDRLPDKPRRDLRHIDAMLWFVLHIAGLTFLLRGRRVNELLLLSLPIAVMSAFNLASIWPFGHFRANLFALVYLSGIAASAFEREPRRTRGWDALPAAVMVLLPLLLLEKGWHRHKESLTTMPGFAEETNYQLIAAQGVAYPRAPETLVADHYACRPIRYYTSYNPTTHRLYGEDFARRFRMTACQGNAKRIFKELRSALRQGAPRAWMVVGSPDVARQVETDWPSDLVMRRFDRPDVTDELVVEVTRPAPAAAE